jgi:hypothetical protein
MKIMENILVFIYFLFIEKLHHVEKKRENEF